MRRCTLTPDRSYGSISRSRCIVIEGPDDTIDPAAICIVKVTWDDGTVSSATLRGVEAARQCMSSFVLLGAGRGFPNAKWEDILQTGERLMVDPLTIAGPDPKASRMRGVCRGCNAEIQMLNQGYCNRCWRERQQEEAKERERQRAQRAIRDLQDRELLRAQQAREELARLQRRMDEISASSPVIKSTQPARGEASKSPTPDVVQPTTVRVITLDEED